MPTPKKFTYFIGIDVSRNELDYAVMRGNKLLFHKEAKNEPDDILNFISELKTLPNYTLTKSVFCMEQTGFYCNHLLNTLKKFKANVVIENALQIRNSLGVLRNKNDKIDAIRIAQYSYINRESLKVRVARRPVLIRLANLFTLRNRLLGIQISLKNPLKEQSTFIQKGIHKELIIACKGSIEAIKKDLEQVDKSIDVLINSEERLRRLNEIIISIPSVGRITAIQVIISTNEFIDINDAKKFACYAGVAPFKKESGLIGSRARVSHIANKKVKSLLHICAIGALKYDNEFNDYYKRKVLEGKNKMAVLNAVRFKLILRIFSCVKDDRLYAKNYLAEIKQQ